jgi:hypothetical protein
MKEIILMEINKGKVFRNLQTPRFIVATLSKITMKVLAPIFGKEINSILANGAKTSCMEEAS